MEAQNKEVQMEANSNIKGNLVLWRIKQIGRTVASAASLGLIYLSVSSDLFSVGLESPDMFLSARDSAKIRQMATRPTHWRQLVGLCGVAGVGIFLALCPSHGAVAVSGLSRLRHGAVNPEQTLRLLLSVGFYLVSGPSLMMLNKHIMQGVGFRYPLSLSALGLLTCAVCSRIVSALGFVKIRSESLELVAGCSWYRVALPIGLCKAITLATGNAVYLHLGLGFIQMLKAFTPVIVLLTMRIFGAATPSRSAVGFVCIIVVGTLVEVNGELHATALGLLLMFTSECMEATGLVLTQKLLQNSKFTIVEGMYVLAPPGAACLLAAAALLEWPRMVAAGHQRMLLDRPLWFAAAAALGLLVNFAGFFVVQATSSLTCKILNQARCIALVFIGAIWYGEAVTILELAGYSVSLTGFFGYNFVLMFPESGEQLERGECRRCCCPLHGSSAVEDEGKTSLAEGRLKDQSC